MSPKAADRDEPGKKSISSPRPAVGRCFSSASIIRNQSENRLSNVVSICPRLIVAAHSAPTGSLKNSYRQVFFRLFHLMDDACLFIEIEMSQEEAGGGTVTYPRHLLSAQRRSAAAPLINRYCPRLIDFDSSIGICSIQLLKLSTVTSPHVPLYGRSILSSHPPPSPPPTPNTGHGTAWFRNAHLWKLNTL
ncbi:hypothetical protein J6590_034634 [Homalodisca vitripennis]|nr:hypothetical protein J6590_034634 [Homalodisca vitripennis]